MTYGLMVDYYNGDHDLCYGKLGFLYMSCLSQLRSLCYWNQAYICHLSQYLVQGEGYHAHTPCLRECVCVVPSLVYPGAYKPSGGILAWCLCYSDYGM